ncbi:MAG TPA: ABC transporter permease [Planctomycetota bacterium]|nr:ABC transporter permease [Planctomycetota bacterium]
MNARRVAWASLAVLAGTGLLAPFLCNDVPLVARTADGLRFPAFAALRGIPPAPPSGATWKEWWASAREDEGEWALMPPWPFGPNEVSREVLRGPSVRHPLGTDDTGRDVLARVVHGASTSLLVAAGTVALAGAIGIPLGALAGYHAFGWTDALVLRAIEVFLCFPALFLALAAVALLGGSPLTLVLVLGTVYWTHFARIVRGEFLALREREFVLAARNLGLSGWRIATRHMLPQVRGAVLVVGAFLAAGAMVVESSLAFLGLGAGLRTPSLGSMLAQGKEHAHVGAWHLWVFPGLVLTWAVLCLHVLADRDGLPRAAGRTPQ